MISRLRSNSNLFDQPKVVTDRKQGRPRLYGNKLGTTSSLAIEQKEQAQEYVVNLYSRKRNVLAYDQIVMLKTLKCTVRVVWIYRRTQWVALFTTDLTLSVVEYYGARWKIDIYQSFCLYKSLIVFDINQPFLPERDKSTVWAYFSNLSAA